MKALKILGKVLLVILALLVISMFVIPHFYKEEIAELVKTEINKQLNAEVNFEEIDLSLFRSFPNFSLALYKLSVRNSPTDTILTADGLYISIGLFSVIKDEAVEIKSIKVEKPELFLKVDKQGQENWNIFKESEVKETVEDTQSEEFVLLINRILINSCAITYNDDEADISVFLNNLNGFLKGKFAADRSDLDLKLNSDDVSVYYQGMQYLRNASLALSAIIDANIKDEIYKLKKNSLHMNGLQINFEGSVAYVDDDLNLMLVYNAPDNSFKQLLSLIPVIYQENFEDLVTTGQFRMDGHVKGTYSESDLPDFKIHMQTANTEISYQGMPSSFKNIEFDLLVENKGKDLDNTIIRLDKCSGIIGSDEVNLSLHLTKPITDPLIDLKASGTLKLENINDVFPQKELQSLNGKLLADLTLKGRLSAADQNDYKNFLAIGSLVCDNISYNYDDNYLVELFHAQFNFSPSQIDIIGFDSRINGNNVAIDGEFENYLSYFLKDDIFKGNLNLHSDKLDINQLLEPWSANEATGGENESEESVTYIPQNIDVVVLVSADSISYNKLLFTDFNSTVHVHDGRIEFEDFNSSFLDGLINLNGYYEATSTTKPHVNFELNLIEMNINTAYQDMSLFRQFTPIAEKAVGSFTTSLSLSADLDNQMNPVWTSLLGNGSLSSDNIAINANEIFSRISDVLKVKLFDNPTTGPIDVNFKMLDGRIFHSPFNVTVNNISMEVGGWTGFDQQIDYNIGFVIPVEMLGNDVSSVINYYASEAGKLGFDVGDVQSIKPVIKVEGDAANPQINLISLGNVTGASVKDIVEDKIEEVIDDYMEEANKEAERIIAEAQREADSLIKVAQAQVDGLMQLANQSVIDIKSEAKKQSELLVKEAAKQGALAELVAKEAATELLKSADKEADNVLLKAQQESDKIVENAHKQSDAIMQKALEKADQIRK